MQKRRLSCLSCQGYPIAPEPFKCQWAKWALFPWGGQSCNAFEYEPGTDEQVAIEEGVIDERTTV